MVFDVEGLRYQDIDQHHYLTLCATFLEDAKHTLERYEGAYQYHEGGVVVGVVTWAIHYESVQHIKGNVVAKRIKAPSISVCIEKNPRVMYAVKKAIHIKRVLL